MIYVWLTLLILLLIIAWMTNLFGLPGNWMMVLLVGLWAWWQPEDSVMDISGWSWAGTLALAGLGELFEFLASVLGAKRAGGSRRAAVLSIVGSIVGGLTGAVLGLPIPLIGWLVGSVLFACLGAFIGALVGERWYGSDLDSSVKVGTAAFVGRLLGTIGKLATGAGILVVAILSLFF